MRQRSPTGIASIPALVREYVRERSQAAEWVISLKVARGVDVWARLLVRWRQQSVVRGGGT